jgi:phage repressor protein C with HTH and peptisase S24 domain
MSKQQVVAIQNNDIKIFANIDTFTKAVQEKNVSQTFSLVTEATTASGIEKQEATLLSLLNTPQITENTEEITKNISSTLSDEKQILDPSQDEKVNSSLYPEFYSPELKEVESAFVAGDYKAFDIAYAKIERRIQTVYQSFGMTYTKT